MLMFAKFSLKSFVYDVINVFSFPNEEVKAVYDQYDINLTNTDSCSMFFVFICSLDCNVNESEFRKTLFKIFEKIKYC